MLGLRNNLDLVQKVQIFYIPHKTSNTQFPAQSICSPKHFGYKPIPKTEVPETRLDYSSTVHDLEQCSAYILAEHFILLNSRLDKIFVESKNARIGIRTRKVWSSKVDAVDSQGCGEIWVHPRLPFCSGFCCPETQCSISDSPKTL